MNRKLRLQNTVCLGSIPAHSHALRSTAGMQPGAAQLVSDIEHARAERLRRVELRVEKAEGTERLGTNALAREDLRVSGGAPTCTGRGGSECFLALHGCVSKQMMGAVAFRFCFLPDFGPCQLLNHLYVLRPTWSSPGMEGCMTALRASEALRQQHSADLAKEGAQSAQRVQAMRQQGETSMLAAEARARAARERREELEAQDWGLGCRSETPFSMDIFEVKFRDLIFVLPQVAAIGAETAELEAEAAARREQLAERLQDIDVRTAKAVLSAEVEMQSLRLEAAESAKATYVALKQEGIKTRQRQDQFGGLREAITGVTACQRDHQLQSVPVVKPRTFDLEESPFDGVGKFGSSKPLQVPKGFYAEAGAAKAARRIAKPTP